MVPPFDGGDDFIGIGGPDERLGLAIVLGDVAVDGSLQVDDGMKDSALEATLRQLGEEALDGVEPGGRSRRVMEHKAWVPAEPGPRLGVLVRAVIVEDHVNDLAWRNFSLDGI